MMLGPTIRASGTFVDHYVRLDGKDLQDLNLDLLWTEVPDTFDAKSLGYAEWAGYWRGAAVSVAIFWRSSAGGPESLSDPLDVSTNLMLVDQKGYDAGTKGTAVALMRMIEKWDLSGLIEAVGARRQRPAGSGGQLQ